MTSIDNHVLSAVFRLAGPSRTPALMARLAPESDVLLRARFNHSPLPAHLVEHVIASGDRDLLEEMARSQNRQRLLLRLARLGDPVLGHLLYDPTESHRWSEERAAVRAAVLQAANPADPGWRGPDGLVAKLLLATDSDVLRPALHGPFPEVVRHALEVIGRDVSLPQQLAACLAVLTHGGPAELAALAELPHLTPAITRVVRHALASEDPAAVLTEAKATQNTPIQRLRRGETVTLAELEAEVDWPALLAEHRRDPLPRNALRQIAFIAGCPAEILVSAYEKSVIDVNHTSNPLPWTVLTADDWGSADNIRRLSHLLGRGIAERWFPIDRVLAEVRPARQVINALPLDQEPVRQAVAALARPLGADFATWRTMYTLLPRFTGSSTELVAAAIAESKKHRGKPWPKPLAWDIPARPATGGRAAFSRLLALADPAVQRAVVPHLDDRAVQHLLMGHDLDEDILTYVGRTRGIETLYGMAAYSGLSFRNIDYLLGLDEPGINASVYRYAKPSVGQQRAILAGQRHRPGRTDPLPLADELVRALVDENGEASMVRDWLLPICFSGDPYLIRVLLGRVKLHTPAARLRLLVGLWERHGPDEVRLLLAETAFPGRRSSTHPLPPDTHEITKAALAAPDGLDLLRKHLDAEWSPAGSIAFLRAQADTTPDKASKALEQLIEETDPDLPWAALRTAHEHEPLPDSLLVALSKKVGCLEELRQASQPASIRLSHPAHSPRRRGSRLSPLDLLRQYPLQSGSGGIWVADAVAKKLLTPLDILRYAYPAHHAATILAKDAMDMATYREARELAAAHLGDDPDAWALAVRLLPEFTSTIPKLLATAAAVVG